MRKFILLVVATLMGFISFAESDIKEVMAIKRVIESAYLDGVQNIGDMAKIDAGFHPNFRMQVLGNNGQLSNVSLAQFKQRVKNNMADGVLPRRVGKHVRVNYQSIDVTGNTASLKMDYMLEGKIVYIDYMHMYKFADGWKIVNKIYHTVDD